jgi:GNAT superfamily N-acetyltransferase
MIAMRHPETQIRRATLADTAALSRLIAVAFDPLGVSRWLVPDPAERGRILAGYFRIMVEHAMVFGAVHTTADQVGVAVWLPVPGPQVAGYEQSLRLACGGCADRFRALDAAMHTTHPAGPPHDHLVFLAVHPTHQGQGIGGALLRHHHENLDGIALSSYLEAGSSDSCRLYGRHGYAPVAEPFAPPGCQARLYPMWRDPTSES